MVSAFARIALMWISTAAPSGPRDRGAAAKVMIG
jgi:hypothetical protein